MIACEGMIRREGTIRHEGMIRCEGTIKREGMIRHLYVNPPHSQTLNNCEKH